jgi:TolB-like protein/Tfp pilus assembly protein PilF
MAGYTVLAQHDEARALRLLASHNSILRSILRRYRGREVKTIGDAFLVEFDSALEAVLCAVKIQAAFRERNASAQDRDKILIRIGIHVGDVVLRRRDIFGDTVNIASRVVRLADPGGVCLTEQVYAQVRNKLEYRLEKLPAQRLKNIEPEMAIYRVILPWEEETTRLESQQSANRIAILPFANISPNPRDGYFAEGLTEELISNLSEVQGLRVIAKTSTNRYRSADKNIAQIGRELQVSHLLDGSVRMAGKQIRVATQLIDVQSQEQVWAAQYDRDLDDVLSIQSDIARSVIDSLKVKLLPRARTRIEKKDTQSVSAYIAYLRGRTLLREATERGAMAAREQFELAIKNDPSYAKAHAGLADTHTLLGDYLFAPVPVALGQARTSVKKALELDPNLAEARVSLANLLMYDYKFSEAEREFRKAIEINPSYATGHHWYSVCLQTLGRLNEALNEVLAAEELDPLSPAITISVIYRLIGFGLNDEVEKRILKLKEIGAGSYLLSEAEMAYHFARGDWDGALIYLKKMISEDPTDPYLEMDLAYIYAATGRRSDALKLVERLKGVHESARIKGQSLAFVYVGLGDVDEAFVWLNHALKHKESFIGWVRGYPLFEPVRSDPRFRDLLKRAKLPAL